MKNKTGWLSEWHVPTNMAKYFINLPRPDTHIGSCCLRDAMGALTCFPGTALFFPFQLQSFSLHTLSWPYLIHLCVWGGLNDGRTSVKLCPAPIGANWYFIIIFVVPSTMLYLRLLGKCKLSGTLGAEEGRWHSMGILCFACTWHGL